MMLRNKILSAISVNKGCHSHQQLHPPPTVSRWALRELRKEIKNTCHLAAIRLQPLPGKPWGNSGCFRILAPESWSAYQRNDFSEPRLLQLPIHRKVPNSLTQDIWFSLINNNLWMTTCPLLQNFYITWLLASPRLLGAVSQSYL